MTGNPEIEEAAETATRAVEAFAYYLGGSAIEDIAAELAYETVESCQYDINMTLVNLTPEAKRSYALRVFIQTPGTDKERFAHITTLLSFGKPGIARRQIALERERLAVQYRVEGMSYAEIATELGYGRWSDGEFQPNPGSAHKAVSRSLDKVVTDGAEVLKRLNMQRLESLLATYLKGGIGGNDYHAKIALDIMARMEKLAGLERLNLNLSGGLNLDHSGEVTLKAGGGWEQLVTAIMGQPEQESEDAAAA